MQLSRNSLSSLNFTHPTVHTFYKSYPCLEYPCSNLSYIYSFDWIPVSVSIPLCLWEFPLFQLLDICIKSHVLVRAIPFPAVEYTCVTTPVYVKVFLVVLICVRYPLFLKYLNIRINGTKPTDIRNIALTYNYSFLSF